MCLRLAHVLNNINNVPSYFDLATNLLEGRIMNLYPRRTVWRRRVRHFSVISSDETSDWTF